MNWISLSKILTKYILAQNSKLCGLVTSYTRQATSQSSSVGVNISHIIMSTSWSWRKHIKQYRTVTQVLLIDEGQFGICHEYIDNVMPFIHGYLHAITSRNTNIGTLLKVSRQACKSRYFVVLGSCQSGFNTFICTSQFSYL